MNKQEILIIDDEPQILKLLQIALEAEGYKVIPAATGKEGIAFAVNHQPDMILLDLGLPDLNGQEVLKKLRDWYSRPILILSVQNTEDDIVKALDAGATDYLSKPFRTRELLARIRSCMRRNENLEESHKHIFGDLEIDLAARTVKRQDQFLKLTATEYNLLALFSKNQGRVLTHQFILKEIWGVGYQTETQYLRVFIAQLRKKIEPDPNNPTHIITESGVGVSDGLIFIKSLYPTRFLYFHPYRFQVTFVLSEQHYGRTDQFGKCACKLFEDKRPSNRNLIQKKIMSGCD
jgi:two-component system KDP operon response regulator KdpE